MINSNCIYFRMRSEKDKTRLTIGGSSIAIRVLKQKIAELKNFKEDVAGKKKGPNPAYVLILFNEQTKEEYLDDGALIQSGTSVVVKRTPVSRRPKIDADSNKHEEEAIPALPVPKPQESLERYERLVKMILDGNIPDFLVCSHCEGMIENPGVSTCCGHEGCEDCLQKTQNCRQCQQKFEILKNNSLKEMLEKVKNEIGKWFAEREISPELQPYMIDAVYFQVKSDNADRLLTSLRHSEWLISNAEIAELLNTEFASKTNVLFVFVTYVGAKFCGLGKMMTPVVKRYPVDMDAGDRGRVHGVINLKWLIRVDISVLKAIFIRGKDGPLFKRNTATEIKPMETESAEKLMLLIDAEPKNLIPDFIPFTEAQSTADPKVESEGKQDPNKGRKHHNKEHKPRHRSRTPDRHKNNR